MPDVGPKTSLHVSRSLMEKVKERRENPRDLVGFSWGFPTLDWMTGGIQTGLTVLGAETGAGKSLIAGQIAYVVASQLREEKSNKVVRVIHAEMTAEQFQQRLIAMIADVNERDIRSGRLTDAEYKRVWEASVELSKLPIEYVDEPASLSDTVAFIGQSNKCAWYLVDHAQSHPTNRLGQSPLDIGALGELAVELGRVSKHIPGLLLSQLTNEVGKREDHRPTKSDLYGGKALQQPASLILLLYRPDVYQQVSEDRRYEPKTAHLILDKNRHTSEVGDVKLIWNPAKAQFVDAGFKATEKAA